MNRSSARWRSDGVRIIRPGEFDSNIDQTPGLRRLAAVTMENTGATKLWAGTFTVDAKAKTLAIGAAQTLAKPFKRGDLLRAVADLLESPTHIELLAARLCCSGKARRARGCGAPKCMGAAIAAS